MSEAFAEPSAPRRILIVDDDPHTASLLRGWFAAEPWEILAAADGAAGLEAALEHAPDLVVLDLRMPGLDGLGVARRLKDDASTRGIPILLLTACRDIESKVEAFAVGADDYVTKPFAFSEIDARIRSLLRRRTFLASLESRVRDLTTTKQELENLLRIDEKTGLYNFREFQRRLREEWSRAVRYEVPLALVLLDLDHFKRVNDTLGHPAGDRVLRELATLVTGGARENDVAARYGGEEFAVILPHTDGPMAARVAERIRVAVREFVFLDNERPTRITVSSGVASYPASPEADSVDGLVRAADRALYAAKDAGRDCVRTNPPGLEIEGEGPAAEAPRMRNDRAIRSPASLDAPPAPNVRD